MTPPPRLTILFDNEPGLPALTRLWGFAALIRVGDRTVLFDTGSHGRVLLKNMAALGLSAESLDLLFLSHPHWDHIGGWDSVLELNPRLTVVVHEGFSKHLIRDLRGLCGDLIVVGADPRPLAPGLFSTGMLDSNPPEHALVIDTVEVTAAISGCAHPGMERIVERGVGLLGKSVDWAIGGFHLMDADPVRIEQSVRNLKALGVTGVVPTHCTGDAGKAAFRRAFGAACLDGGVGRDIGA
ncbi:MBL fold metallo-hydrolase [Thiocapsa bogorovii]|uniref:MBL fold metallo-hydrolase n=1 Tax=Thiocapsa bogorovii TaxID=521689 RepID=UPI001E42C94C|nr:MBL fold metallo-hydrolase [Thiocapsa bogorovii]UHD17224.1 MBL fold metallo-hydrolase [Thiocapsa bogorovii]